ncbi:MAG: tetratricopeptide repeat protein [Bacteroidales bacterium]
MKGKTRYTFAGIAVLLLILLVFLSRYAGRNCDEVLHHEHSLKVLNYYASGGSDKSAVNTPVTHLQYYGQSYDNFTTLLEKILGIEDVYRFRHLMSAIAGWLAIVITGLLAAWITGWEAGIIALLLLSFSPVFIGHSQNNLKDIPFALGYVASILLIFKFISDERRFPWQVIIPLIIAIAFTFSIRPGGLVLFCYLLLFTCLYYIRVYWRAGLKGLGSLRMKLLLILTVIVLSYLLGILFWPYALEDPIRNPLESYKVMTRFPDTFRQIFEGKEEWSDFMPWYYLPKSMIITIPLVIFMGVLLFFINAKKRLAGEKSIFFWLVLFAIFFPMVFVIISKANLYSSWRHFLFIYPLIIVIAAAGFDNVLQEAGSASKKLLIYSIIGLLSLSPLFFMVRNYPYSYVYYNQIVGGIRGANGNYETDYYYISQREASEWLKDYLREKGRYENITVAANFSVSDFFRDMPGIKTIYVRHQERSLVRWDYLIMTNRYVDPSQLKKGIWPPADALKIIYADSVPLGAVVRRSGFEDVEGYEALDRGDYDLAADLLGKALSANKSDEMIFYNFAAAMAAKGLTSKADSLLKIALDLDPGFDLAMMYMGDLALKNGDGEEAATWYRKTIENNRKFFEAYVSLAAIIVKDNMQEARKVLKDCLDIRPDYKPAIQALADSYRSDRPDLAKKYDELAKTIKDN